MAKSHSNLGYETSFDVSLIPSPTDSNWEIWISIVPFPFPENHTLTLFKGDDQQLIDLKYVVDEYIEDNPNSTEEKLQVAEFFENLARKIRSTI